MTGMSVGGGGGFRATVRAIAKDRFGFASGQTSRTDTFGGNAVSPHPQPCSLHPVATYVEAPRVRGASSPCAGPSGLKQQLWAVSL